MARAKKNSLISEGDTGKPVARVDQDFLIRLEAAYAAMEQDRDNWRKRYENAAVKVTAFNSIARQLTKLGYVSPAELR